MWILPHLLLSICLDPFVWLPFPPLLLSSPFLSSSALYELDLHFTLSYLELPKPATLGLSKLTKMLWQLPGPCWINLVLNSSVDTGYQFLRSDSQTLLLLCPIPSAIPFLYLLSSNPEALASSHPFLVHSASTEWTLLTVNSSRNQKEWDTV